MDIAEKTQIQNTIEDANNCLGKKFDVEKVTKGFEFFLEKIKEKKKNTKDRRINEVVETKETSVTEITDMTKKEEQVKQFWKEKNKSLEKIYGKGNVWVR